MLPFSRNISGLLAAFCLLATPAAAQTVVQLIDGYGASPSSLAVDGSGNVVFANDRDGSLGRIGPVDGFTSVTTQLATSGPTYYIAIDSHRNLFVAEQNESILKEITADSGYTQKIQLANSYYDIRGIALDSSDNLYISTELGGGIYELTVESNYEIMRQLAKSGGAQGIAVDGAGNVFFASTATNTAYEIVAVGGGIPDSPTVRTLAGGFNNPQGIAVDGTSNLYVADTANNAVKEISAAGGYATVTTLTSTIAQPNQLAVDAGGNIFVTAIGGSTVQELVASGGYGTVATIGTGFSAPAGLTFDHQGNLYIADHGSTTVYEASAASEYGAVTQAYVGLAGAAGLAFDGSGNIFVADNDGNGVKEIVAAGGYATIKTLGSGFKRPYGVAVDAAGNVFVTDNGNSAVKEILAAGGYQTVRTLGSGFREPFGIALDKDANVFVADGRNEAVSEISAASGYTTVTALGSGFQEPIGIAIDPAGNIFVADTGYGVKELLASSGYTSVTPVAPFGVGMIGPIAVDSADNVYTLMYGNNVGAPNILDAIPAGSPPIVASVLPGARSVEAGTAATAFATMINTGSVPLDNCRIVVTDFNNFGYRVDYQTTDPGTNALTGAPDTPVTIPGGDGIQTFLISVPEAPQDGFSEAVPLTFACDGAIPAPTQQLVDTLDLSVTSVPVPDIIALAATPTNDGILRVPLGAAAAFAVATSNVGAAGTGVAVSAGLTDLDNLPGTATICQTDPSTGQCLAPPVEALTIDYPAGAALTFSVFVASSGPIPFDPVGTRVGVYFSGSVWGGSSNEEYGGTTSVAVETQ